MSGSQLTVLQTLLQNAGAARKTAEATGDSTDTKKKKHSKDEKADSDKKKGRSKVERPSKPATKKEAEDPAVKQFLLHSGKPNWNNIPFRCNCQLHFP